MIAIIDYGSGNLRSVQKAFEHAGAAARITQQPADILKADKVVLPGVGAIAPAMKKLSALRLVGPIKDVIARGTPFLGICLGLQLLFEKSAEGGEVKTLAVLPGRVVKFTRLKVPHMGWNAVDIKTPRCPFLKGIRPGTDLYFCHSFFAAPTQKTVIAAQTRYGRDFAAAVWKGNLFAVQFHPEKSQAAGLTIIKNFCAFKP